jgi:hypothetical protein
MITVDDLLVDLAASFRVGQADRCRGLHVGGVARPVLTQHGGDTASTVSEVHHQIA